MKTPQLHRHAKAALLLAVALTTPAWADALAPAPLKVTPAVAMKLQAFSLKEVRLLPSSFKDAMELDKAYLLSLEPERLLHTFRLTAGLPSTAQPYGGWEDPKGELRGHSLGHYLSAISLMYASTGEEVFKIRADYLVAELAKCQAAMTGRGFNPGFLSAYPEEFFDRVDACKHVWAPYYTLHKIMAGLLDAHVQCANPQALDVLNQMAGWLTFRIERLSHEQQQRALGNEHGGMSESLANLYAITGNPAHLKLAIAFNHENILAPLSQKQDKLDGKHANTQIPKILGALREYELNGDPSLLTAAETFWQAVALNRSYVIGGHSDSEHFYPVSDFAKHLSPVTAETCNTYNMLKLTRHLFALAPSARLMDFYERALYNQILGSIEPEHGMVNYFVSLKPGHFKVYSTPDKSFWCCTGTGMENHAKYGESIFFHDDKSLYLNLFIPAELQWKERGVTIRQETTFPESDRTQLTFKCAQPISMDLKVRWPSWAKSGLQIRVNGQEVKVTGEPGSYVSLVRQWQDGDKVELQMPMSLQSEALPGNNPRTLALLHGPIVLAAELGTQGLEKKPFWLRGQTELNNFPTPEIPHLVCEPSDLIAHLQPVADRAMTYRTQGIGHPGEVVFSPLYKLHYQRYSVYWKLLSSEEWKVREAEIVAQEAQRKAEEARIVDSVAPGEQQPETDHQLKAEKSQTGEFNQRKWRDAVRGWFSYELKVASDKPMTLRCTYWGDEKEREFDILINGQKLATQKLGPGARREFISQEYAIPPELTQGKPSVTVKFQAAPNSIAGGLFGLVMLQSRP